MQNMERTNSQKSIAMVNEVGQMVWDWYKYAEQVRQQGGNIAWCMLVPPNDILLSMDVIPISTEQFATAAATKQVAEGYCERADREGFHVDICGYCRLGLGYSATQKEFGTPYKAPYGGLPKPDMMIGRSHCDPGYKWYQAAQRYFKTPCYVYENLFPAPDSGHFFEDPEIEQQYLTYYREQLKGLVAFLETHTGRKLDFDRLRKRIRISQETRQLWWNIHLMRKTIPSPMPTEDFMSCIFPYITMHASDKALDFFRRLHAEVKSRVDNKIGVVPEEKYRLLWVGIPPWHHMVILNAFEDYGAVCCIEYQYPPPVPIDLDLSDPIDALARRDYWAGCQGVHTTGFPKRGEESYGIVGGAYRPVSALLKLAEEYRVDGVVMHHITSCRNAIIGHRHGERVLRERLGIPTLFLESDMVDPRGYDHEAILRAVDTFMEAIAASKG